MKKKILGGIAIIAIAAVTAFNVNFNTQSDNLSAIGLENVEALAQSEGSGLCSTYCTSSSNSHCQGTNSSMTFTCYYMRPK